MLQILHAFPRSSKLLANSELGGGAGDGVEGDRTAGGRQAPQRSDGALAGKQARTTQRALPAGDYTVEADDEPLAVVKRKTLANLAHGLVDGSLGFMLAELSALPRAAVVVEDRYSRVFKLEHVQPGFVAELLAAVRVPNPSVPILFLESRSLA
jgi:ERCC4-type nuclease